MTNYNDNVTTYNVEVEVFVRFDLPECADGALFRGGNHLREIVVLLTKLYEMKPLLFAQLLERFLVTDTNTLVTCTKSASFLAMEANMLVTCTKSSAFLFDQLM